MAEVYLSIGSNIDRENHIRAGMSALNRAFGEVLSSRIYESEAVGFDGEDFFNLVVRVDTDLSVAELSELLRDIENINGRDRSTPKFSARTLDIDILTYNNLTGSIAGVELPRAEILKNAFVLLPLAELNPTGVHPLVHKTYAQLWNDYDKSRQKLWPAAFQLNE